MMALMALLRIATYNIRHAVGSGWRPQKPDIARVAEVICALDADVVCLQEVLTVTGRSAEENQAAFLADACGYPCRATGENHRWANGGFGNVTLSRVPFLAHTNHDLTVGSRVPRGCLQADFEFHGRIVHLFNLHLGLSWRERGHQLAKLAHLARNAMHSSEDVRYTNALTIFAGDFNEWIPFRLQRWSAHASEPPLRSKKGREQKRLTGHCLRTFRSNLPLLSFDGFFASAPPERISVHHSLASDHLPVVVEFTL